MHVFVPTACSPHARPLLVSDDCCLLLVVSLREFVAPATSHQRWPNKTVVGCSELQQILLLSSLPGTDDRRHKGVYSCFCHPGLAGETAIVTHAHRRLLVAYPRCGPELFMKPCINCGCCKVGTPLRENKGHVICSAVAAAQDTGVHEADRVQVG